MKKYKKFKNKLVKLHRFTGSIMALLMLVWFISGIVLLYSEFPEWQNKDKLEFYDDIEFTDINDLYPLRLKSKKIDYYKISENDFVQYQKGLINTLFDNNGSELKNITKSTAQKIATLFLKEDSSDIEYNLLSERDIWLSKNVSNDQFPVYKFSFTDEKKSEIYISSVNGEILQYTTEKERLLAWFGAIPHLIYFKDFSDNSAFWRWILILLSGLGSLMSFLGLLTGIIRFKKKIKKRKKSKLKFTPYGSRLYSIHHYLGFCFGIFAFTWVFSGLISLNVLGVFLDKGEELKLVQIWEKNFAEVTELTDIICIPKKTSIREISLEKFLTENIVLYNHSNIDSYRLINGEIYSRNSPEIISSAIDKIKNTYGDFVSAYTVLNDYDNYYFKKRRDKILPVIKVEFNNSIESVFYFDPLKLKIVKKSNYISRINRWLYKALHRFDFFNNKTVWYCLMWVLLVGGSSLALTANLFYFRKKIKRI